MLFRSNFVAWSERMSQATDGKSKGNVRIMHKGAFSAVGKLIYFEPLDDKKAFYVGAKIVDEEAWQKIVEGVYTGFSVGGRYGRRFPDALLKGYTRYEALPSEISLVDSPAAPNARFEMVKMDGETEMRKFATLEKGESLDDLVSQVRQAWQTQFNACPDDPTMRANDAWVVDVQTDQVIVDQGESGIFAYSYGQDEAGAIMFGAPVPVEKQYVLKKGANMAKLQDILTQMKSSDSQDIKALAAQLEAAFSEEENTETQEETAEGEPAEGQAPPATAGENDSPTATTEAGAAPDGQGLSADAVKEIVINLLVELGLAQKQGDVAQKADFTGDLQKSIHTYGSTLGQLDQSLKGLGVKVASMDTLQKSFDGLQVQVDHQKSEILSDLAKVAAGAESLHARLEIMEKRGGMGPVLRELGGISPQALADSQQAEVLAKMAEGTNDPQLRQKLQAESARLKIKIAQSQPIS